MVNWLSIGQMIDSLLSEPKLKFVDSNNEWTTYIDSYGCVVFQKFDGHRITTLLLEDKDTKWKIKE